MTVAEFLGVELDQEAGFQFYMVYLLENPTQPMFFQGMGYHTLGVKHPIPEEMYGLGPTGRVEVFLSDVKDIRPMTFEEFLTAFGVFG